MNLRALDWAQFAGTWPNSDRSEFTQTESMRWHIQRWPHVDSAQTRFLLLHGTGASSHSWFGLAPELSRYGDVIAVDLPGHGFSQRPVTTSLSLDGMADALGELLKTLRWQPTVVIGHSAGAALAVQLALNNAIDANTRIISINGALIPFGAYALPLMAPLSKVLAQFSVIPSIFSWQSRSDLVVNHLLAQTGSTVPNQSKRCYKILMSNAFHSQSALKMMAAWDLKTLTEQLPQLKNSVTLIACADDRTISPQIAQMAKALLPQAQLHFVPRLGHLGHEEDPALFCALLK
jgi:magnesium chelatase accessory protein